MEEMEVPTEKLHETIEEKVEEAIKEKGWSMYVAISTALIAVLAAISALLAGRHSDEALISKVAESDHWAFYQAKGIKADIISLEINGNKANAEEVEKYKKDQDKIKNEADYDEKEYQLHHDKHMQLSQAVTLFQIAIAISAIAILTRKKFLWYASLALAGAGIYFFITGLV